MDRQERVDRAVVELDGVWPDMGFKGTLWINTDGYRGDKKGYSAYGGDKGCIFQDYICTYPEFMESRARLENKPNWDDAPEWAEWLAQDADGRWVFYRGGMKQDPEPEGGEFKYDSGDPLWSDRENHKAAGKGHAFTDWRQSLERRPESKPGQETLNPQAQQAEAWLNVCETLSEVCPNWLDLDSRAEDCAVLAIEGLANRSPSTNNEHHDHKEGEGVKWEPGVDLPPVGEVCEVSAPGDKWVECEVIAHFMNPAGMVAAFTIESPNGCKALDYYGPYSFRKTRRKEVIAEAMSHALFEYTDREFEVCHEFSSRLYNAGLLGDNRGDQ